MRTQVRTSTIDVIGYIWQPGAGLCAMTYTMREPYDIDNALDDDGCLTRESVERWLLLNSGDFASITDFRIDISLADGTDFTSDFDYPDSEGDFADCMFGNG
jgi:hypothetical protein